MTLAPTSSAAKTTFTLNAFQVLMRRWRMLGPYNAGQVMTLSGTPDFVRWVSAVQKVVRATGLGAPQFAEGEASVTMSPGAEIEVASAAGGLDAHVTAELNRPFGPGDVPVRFFILPAGGKYLFGVTYDHWIADSRAIRNLMQRIYVTYCGLPDLEPLVLPRQDFETLYGHHAIWKKPLAKLRASAVNYLRHRKAYRINLADPLNFASKTRVLYLPEGLIQAIHKHAKRRGASVNDPFLAALAL
jgi:hypothetical protein